MNYLFYLFYRFLSQIVRLFGKGKVYKFLKHQKKEYREKYRRNKLPRVRNEMAFMKAYIFLSRNIM